MTSSSHCSRLWRLICPRKERKVASEGEGAGGGRPSDGEGAKTGQQQQGQGQGRGGEGRGLEAPVASPAVTTGFVSSTSATATRVR